MKFPKEFLRFQDWDKTISNQITSHSRWTVDHECVFKSGGKFYLTTYSVGATESQDERPYEYEPDEIECPEVVPVLKTITVYEEVQ